MLKIKPNCECCDVDLPPESIDARICSHECTFCSDCMTSNFNDRCPNCTGEVVRRPIRPAAFLEKNPASTERFLNQNHSGFSNYASRSPRD